MAWTLSVGSRSGADWDDFVLARPAASVYLQSGWSQLAADVFGHRACFVEARDPAGTLLGVLPFVRQKSLLGNFATSVAFFNYGGALADDPQVATALMEQARITAQAAGCSYLELRDTRQHPGDWLVRTDKVSMVLGLPQTFEALSQQLGSKLRSQVKRSEREGFSMRTGGMELADAFYAVFASNMRDLGTPVYPRRFFQAILERFPELCRLVVIDHGGRPAAAAFLVMYQGRAEIPWAACLTRAKPLGFNMRLYWEVLRFVVENGCTSFDFGRSTVDAGTYKFKKQWGAQPQQLYWYRWERNSVAKRGEGPGRIAMMERAAAVWRHLPLPLANMLGPLISPGLPW